MVEVQNPPIKKKSREDTDTALVYKQNSAG